NYAKEYYERVFQYFLDEYEKGRTPNPDVLCNREIKFDAFAKFARSFGADYIATGHYAKLEVKGDLNYLMQAMDKDKDQTYFLNQLTNEQLANVLFPLGDLNKKEVRLIAKAKGLKTADKKDSTGICFIGERRFREFLSEYIPMRQGDIITLDGKIVGTHEGVYYYTIGQRKGLGVGGGGNGEPYFVVKKDVINNVLYVSQGESPELYSNIIEVDNFNYIPESLSDGEYEVECRIRHRQPLQKAKATVRGTRVSLEFFSPQKGVAEGQYAVLYRGDYCIGGGVIERIIGK
ncbi:MAG: tRNA 2-thiouridine(34) synthase MnmA, partial [Clostridia bacterium]|nr:tRNA 2-thiouridine(34) synthase MnmA [Clostridia bacterium]